MAGHVVSSDISFSFHQGNGDLEVLRSVSLEILPGEILVLIGPSGCGKSTFLNIVAGFLLPDSGQVTLDGDTINQPGPQTGVVFQDHNLYPWKTVSGNIEFGLRMQGIARDERRTTIERVIDLVGLEGFESAYPVELSGGMAQRVGIARTLANDPKVMLMDEPFGSLDAQTRGQMQHLFGDVWSRDRKSVLFVTHDIDEAILLADRIVVMSSRPATIIENCQVSLPRPRSEVDLFGNEAIRLRKHLFELLHRDA